MADVKTDDEQDRPAAASVGPSGGSGVALGDEGTDELPALAAIGVGVALIIAFLWPTLLGMGDDDGDHSDTTDTVAAAEDADGEEAGAESDGEEAGAESDGEEAGAESDGDGSEADPAAELPDIPAIQALVDGDLGGDAGPVSVAGEGATVFLSGVVADEATREGLTALAASQPNVASVDATGLVIEEAELVPGAGVDVTASQVQIVLEGTVPDEATRVALVERAVAVYAEDEVEDLLVVDESTGTPFDIRIGGSMTDPVLYNQVAAAFDDVEGVNVSAGEFELAESSDLEASLNSLEPIQFASGRSDIQPDSQAILDEAAELLLANPDVALEIGGHTDSIGRAEGNQSLSEARAQAVFGALQERGVANDLQARGFGETRLKVPNDENDPAAQQENRRIEFRIIG